MKRQVKHVLVATALLSVPLSAAGAQAPVHHWSFDCDWSDLVTGTPLDVHNVDMPAGKLGMGARIGCEDLPERPYIDTQVAPSLGSADSLSIAVWAKLPSALPPGSPHQQLLGLERLHQEIGIRIQGHSGRVDITWRDDDGNTAVLETPESMCDGRWHHFVSIRDGELGLIRLYVDGVLVGTDDSPPGPFNMTSARSLYLGSHNHSDGNLPFTFYSGSLDEVRVYDHALNQSEVLELIPKQRLVQAEIALVGDVDGNGTVDVGDLLVVLANWGTTE